MRNLLYIKKVIILFAICLLSVPFVVSHNNVSSKYIFSAITINNGLPLNFVDDIFKDSRGFIWISTQGGGLMRYDGYGFVQLNVNSFPIALKSNFIKETCEDNFKRLWVITSLGVEVIDLETMQKSFVVSEHKQLEKNLNIFASSILKDKHGSIWILSGEKIQKIDFDKKGDIDKIYTTSEKSNGNSFVFTSIDLIDDDIWVGNNGNVNQVIVNKSGELVLLPVLSLPQTNPNLFISSVLKKENMVWIGTEDGLYRFSLADKSIKHYINNANDPGSVSQNMITSLAVTSDGILVVGTLKGLNLYNTVTDKFDHIQYGSEEASINSDFINCILSEGNTLWIGTESGGVNKMSMRRLEVRNYTHDEKNKYSLSPNPVNAILEDHMGNLWVGTVEGGLNLKLKDEERFFHYKAEPGGLTHNSVSALEEGPQGHLWVGTWGKGLNIMDINKLPKVSYKTIDAALDYVAQIKYDSINNLMWIGTNRNIYYYDPETDKLTAPFPESITKNIKGVLGCIVDTDNILWIGTSEGLIRIELNNLYDSENKFRFRFLTIDDKEISRLFFRNITSIYQCYDKSIWMGSNGYGVCRLKPENGKYTFDLFTIEEGLVNNAVFSVLEDEQGLVWIGTGCGLSCYNPGTNHFVSYTKNDGLWNDQFYWNAGYKSLTNKNLYLGTMNGLSVLKGSHQYVPTEKKSVVFTKLQILNNTIWYNGGKYIKKDIAYANRLNLHERDKSFSIEFSALDYDSPSTVVYSYRLSGFDNTWIDVPSDRRFISYTNLEPGKYVLQVRCMSGSHDWSDKTAEMEIVVNPFFYKTFWFIALCILILILIIVRFYTWRVSSLKTQREVLHKKVEERTKELEGQKKILEEQAVELKLQNNILITQNEKISHQRKQLLDMAEKVQEATSDKISFFTNITHEFRTPITLIIGPVERALKLSTNPKVIEQLQYVVRNSKHLLSLVNQLMDFRKVESESIQINSATGNLLSSLDELLIPFESFAEERGIVLRKLYRMKSPYIVFDNEAIRKVVSNLLSNAIKFTPDKGYVTLYVGSLTDVESNEEKLYISVSDTGIGVKEEDLKRIFERFYQSKGHDKYPVYGQSGTGIGLYLSKNIVEILGGNIHVKNNRKKGTSFRILMPLIKDEKFFEPALSDNINDADKKEDTKTNLYRIIDKKLTVLVVEDNNDMRKYIISILSDYYDVCEAENGEVALLLLRTKHIDFIISDLMMPVMNGLELSRIVKSDFSISHIPFLMLTAKTSLDTQINSYKIGVDEFLAKPFDDELLLARIKNILETRKMYQRKFSLNMNVDELNISEESNDDKFLRKAIEIVKENYKNADYEVSDFIESMGTSKSVLNKKMQILTGQSAGNFIRNYRLNIAGELILRHKGNMNISEIAYEVGFNDPKYFTRCFTKHYGVAPSSFDNKSNNS